MDRLALITYILCVSKVTFTYDWFEITYSDKNDKLPISKICGYDNLSLISEISFMLFFTLFLSQPELECQK